MTWPTTRVEVSPTAHFFMGGVRIDPACHTDLDGLYAAGEDAGGVHGANRLGGNGIADSTVFGGIAGDSMANDVIGRELSPFDESQVAEIVKRVEAPLGREGSDLYPLRDQMRMSNWEKLGIIREEKGLQEGLRVIRELKEKMDDQRLGREGAVSEGVVAVVVRVDQIAGSACRSPRAPAEGSGGPWGCEMWASMTSTPFSPTTNPALSTPGMELIRA